MDQYKTKDFNYNTKNGAIDTKQMNVHFQVEIQLS